MDVLVELGGVALEVQGQVLDLPLRKVLGQQSGFERGGIVEHRAPVHGANALVAHFEHVAGFGAVDIHGTDDRVRAFAGIVDAHLRDLLDGHARLHLVEEM